MTTKLEELTQELFHRAQAFQDLGIAYGVGRDYLPTNDQDEFDGLVKAALLKLFDRNLIFFYRSTWDDGYSVDPNEVIHLGRQELEAELDAGGTKTDLHDQVVFFYRTDSGREEFERNKANQR